MKHEKADYLIDNQLFILSRMNFWLKGECCGGTSNRQKIDKVLLLQDGIKKVIRDAFGYTLTECNRSKNREQQGSDKLREQTRECTLSELYTSLLKGESILSKGRS
ncbi:MAG: hypothetical protein AAGI23_18625, partial [Bacteroidota bacterium]